MRNFKIVAVAGFLVLLGGVGVRYAVERGSMGGRATEMAASALSMVESGVVLCGEARMSAVGELANQQPYLCFAQHLRECSPANLVASVEQGKIKYSRTIQDLRNGRCMVREVYTAIAKPDLIGKSMLCAYDPNLSLDQPINYRDCTGELRDELFNRLPQ